MVAARGLGRPTRRGVSSHRSAHLSGGRRAWSTSRRGRDYGARLHRVGPRMSARKGDPCHSTRAPIRERQLAHIIYGAHRGAKQSVLKTCSGDTAHPKLSPATIAFCRVNVAQAQLTTDTGNEANARGRHGENRHAGGIARNTGWEHSLRVQSASQEPEHVGLG